MSDKVLRFLHGCILKDIFVADQIVPLISPQFKPICSISAEEITFGLLHSQGNRLAKCRQTDVLEAHLSQSQEVEESGAAAMLRNHWS